MIYGPPAAFSVFGWGMRAGGSLCFISYQTQADTSLVIPRRNRGISNEHRWFGDPSRLFGVTGTVRVRLRGNCYR